MWVLSLLPTDLLDVIINIVLIVGIAGFLISFFVSSKLIPIQKILFQSISVILIVLGVYWKGGIAIEKEWRDRVKKAEEAAQKAEEIAKEINIELSKTIAQRDHAVATRGKTIVEKTVKYLEGEPRTHTSTINLSAEERAKLEKEIAELQRAEKECPVPTLVVNAINQAALKDEIKK